MCTHVLLLFSMKQAKNIFLKKSNPFLKENDLFSAYLTSGERSGSAVECLTLDRGAAGSSLTGLGTF